MKTYTLLQTWQISSAHGLSITSWPLLPFLFSVPYLINPNDSKKAKLGALSSMLKKIHQHALVFSSDMFKITPDITLGTGYKNCLSKRWQKRRINAFSQGIEEPPGRCIQLTHCLKSRVLHIPCLPPSPPSTCSHF